jgi:RNA polymerase sigma-70 factor (ECF subfamily)
MIPATEVVWEAFSEKLKGYIARRVSDPADAEDLLQEVFLKIHCRLDSLQDEGRLLPWLYQVARNSVTDYYRAKRPSLPLSEELPDEGSPEGSEAEAQLAQAMEVMLGCLPEKYSQALKLYELEGLKGYEVAERLGISISGAKSRVQRGRVLLRQALLDCCTFEFDRRGGIIDYAPRQGCPPSCGN